MKQRRPLDDQEKINITLARVARLKELGTWPNASELAKRFNRHPAMISRAFTSALSEGLVELTIPARRLHRPQRRTTLENALRTRFKGLLGAVVIKAEESTYTTLGTIPAVGLPDDSLHESLGEAMSEYMTSGPQLFDDRSVIGVGSGRGVGYTVEALRKIVPLPFRTNVTVISLTGSVHSRQSQRRYWLDADMHAALLTTCFDREVRLNLIRHPLTYESDHDSSVVTRDTERQDPIEIFREKTPLGSDNWRDIHPTHALVGVGILAKGHRFFSEAMATEKEQEPILTPIHELLRQLVHLSQKVAREAYTPVADMSNYLFFVPAPEGVRVPESAESEIKHLISRINRKLITIREEQLPDINTMLLVAGTPQKAPAIRELLVNPRYHVRYLCTDEDAAKTVLDITSDTDPIPATHLQ